MGQMREPEPTAKWRCYADWAKRRPLTLRLADYLGRGRGRLRFLDDLIPPKRSALKPDLSGWQDHALGAAWIGHATVLLRMDQWTILMDPVFSSRVGLWLGLMTGGPKRLVAPALSLRELPAIDLILISHAHYDHLDRPTLVRLPKHIPVITSDHNSDLVRDLGFRKVTELRWGERVHHEGLTITAQRVRHWGARVFYDDYRGFNGFLIESSRHRVLYGGDSAYHDYFQEIGKVDLAVVGIGAYDPFVHAHATPEEALAMADHVGAEHVLPMHHSTFKLSREPMREPLERLLDAVGRNEDRVVVREVGGMWSLNGGRGDGGRGSAS